MIKKLWNKLSTFAKKNFERALVVFLTGFTGSFILPELTDIGNPVAWKSALYSAVAAGLAALAGLATKNKGQDTNSPATQ